MKRAKELEGRPARIEVRDPALRDALAAPLAALGTAIVVVEDQPAVLDALRTFEEEEEDGDPMPGLMEAAGMTIERVRAFADAAALFYAAQPWARLANEDLIAVESEQVPRDMRFVGVLGQASELCGLSFFDSRRAFERVFELAHAGDIPTRSNAVIFDRIDGLPFADVDAWQDHGLPAAAPDAYPLAADFAVDGSVRRPSARELSFSEGLLRALATATEDELDAGTWQTRVETFDGPLDLRLSLPLLLEAEAGRPRRHVPRNVTALERAQDLAHEAMDATGRLQTKLARRALAISEDCADAWIVLADAASTAQAAVELYEGGMRAGAAAIGAERFESLRGAFWKDLETRPYMQARLGLAEALTELDRHADAIAHYRALLELDPDDSLGVRYILLAHLLREGSNDEAGRLLAEDRGRHADAVALWPPTLALPQRRGCREHARGVRRCRRRQSTRREVFARSGCDAGHGRGVLRAGQPRGSRLRRGRARRRVRIDRGRAQVAGRPGHPAAPFQGPSQPQPPRTLRASLGPGSIQGRRVRARYRHRAKPSSRPTPPPRSRTAR